VFVQAIILHCALDTRLGISEKSFAEWVYVYCLLFRMPIFVKIMILKIIRCNREGVYRYYKVLQKG